jgi:predicted O-methyltransferase YrrM
MIRTRDEAVAITGIPCDLLDGDVRLLTSVPDVKLAVELGTLRGGGAALLSLVASERVVTIDLFEDIASTADAYSAKYQQLYGTTYQSVKIALETFPKVQIIHGNTRGIPEGIALDSVDLLFIDADHSYLGVKGDYQTWIPYVRRNGRIVFHDYSYGWRDDVKKFVDDEVSNDPRVTFWEFGGISACFVKN